MSKSILLWSIVAAALFAVSPASAAQHTAHYSRGVYLLENRPASYGDVNSNTGATSCDGPYIGHWKQGYPGDARC